MKSPNTESLSVERKRLRAYCFCCGGGETRPGYTLPKCVSRKHSAKAHKPRYKDHRS